MYIVLLYLLNTVNTYKQKGTKHWRNIYIYIYMIKLNR